VRKQGTLGQITLNRPAVINALTINMVRTIDRALDDFEVDATVKTVLVDGNGERGLCAGGDIRSLRDAVVAGDPWPRTFWREEYRLNARIARFPKPIVSFMDGIVMGGGIGLGAHASHRIATERLKAAMPEVGIGLAPDVGGTFLLSRAPGELGTHVALTAAHIGARDALACRLADRIMSSSELDGIRARLREDDLHGLWAETRTAENAPPATLTKSRSWIDAAYAADSAIEIVERLRAHPDPAANAAAETIEAKSPTSVCVTLRALRTVRELSSLEQCLDMEYGIVCALSTYPDFLEGVAAVIDKDRRPRWSPERLADVNPATVRRLRGSRILSCAQRIPSARGAGLPGKSWPESIAVGASSPQAHLKQIDESRHFLRMVSRGPGGRLSGRARTCGIAANLVEHVIAGA